MTAAGATAATYVLSSRRLKDSVGTRDPEAERSRTHRTIASTEALSESGPEHDGNVNVNSQSDRALDNFHAQRAEGEEGVLLKTCRPRAAREVACGGKFVGQHVNGGVLVENAMSDSHGVPWWTAHGVP